MIKGLFQKMKRLPKAIKAAWDCFKSTIVADVWKVVQEAIGCLVAPLTPAAGPIPGVA